MSMIRTVAVALLMLVGTLGARAADTYAPDTKQLTIPSLSIGAATYANVVVAVGEVLSGPMGTGPNGANDTYDPTTGQLTVQSVVVGGTTYFNAVVTVAQLVSIGGVSGADTYDGTYLRIPVVQYGSNSYANVTLAVSAASVISVGQGLPQSTRDGYDAATGRLSIAAVQVGARIYTNVMIGASLADVVAVGPAATIAQVQKDIFTPYCASCHDGSDPFFTFNLSSANSSVASLVNVASSEVNELLVKRRDPEASYLIQKLKGTASIQGVRMPANGKYLTPAQIEEVSSWILGL